MSEYEAISTEQIATQSIDLIICTIGFHHIPLEKIQPFLFSLKRIMRPGGLLIIREHNAITPDKVALVSAAHTLFNLMIPVLTLAEEKAEYRNFQALSYWKEQLAQAGFEAHPEELLQEGDTTDNTLLSFTRLPATQEEAVAATRNQVAQQQDYKRSFEQTFLTAPEWFNVEMAEDYGRFINHTPFYQYPYMAMVKNYWRIFYASWKQARRTTSFTKLLFSPYTLMNLFVGTSATVEYTLKALGSAPIRMLYGNAEAEQIQALVTDPEQELSRYASTIQIVKAYPDAGLTQVILPRYKKLLTLLEQLSRTSITIAEIAGQKAIQCKVRYLKINAPSFTLADCIAQYRWELPTEPQYQYEQYLVPTELLLAFVRQLKEQHVELLYVHDF